ncbi:BREX system Lon protease-like protein BrxL [Culturomica massiliensis]|uniref:BREX system Lon protease-like protein BrxL n=1 Tax=Culturomica massiliensis TaxID=1841857 RepID=UPI0026702842|nr:BREX system Lon protease-like protein BrxL [Culturomica massiliensis]
MDRLYNYISGWEIPKIEDTAYNNNYGLITDYLSEALHYLFTHDSEYFSVVGQSVLEVGRSCGRPG